MTQSFGGVFIHEYETLRSIGDQWDSICNQLKSAGERTSSIFGSDQLFDDCNKCNEGTKHIGLIACSEHLLSFMETKPLLMLGLPKGSLEDSTIRLFGKAGFDVIRRSRSYRPSFNDPELDGRFVRAQEVGRYG